MSETLYLIAFEDGYLSDMGVVLTDAAKADRHAQEVGGVVVPVMRLNHYPKKRMRYTLVSSIRTISNIVERTDFTQHTEWEYEEPIRPDEGKETQTKGVGGLRAFTQVITIGYDEALVRSDHAEAIKKRGGIEL